MPNLSAATTTGLPRKTPAISKTTTRKSVSVAKPRKSRAKKVAASSTSAATSYKTATAVPTTTHAAAQPRLSVLELCEKFKTNLDFSQPGDQNRYQSSINALSKTHIDISADLMAAARAVLALEESAYCWASRAWLLSEPGGAGRGLFRIEYQCEEDLLSQLNPKVSFMNEKALVASLLEDARKGLCQLHLADEVSSVSSVTGKPVFSAAKSVRSFDLNDLQTLDPVLHKLLNDYKLGDHFVLQVRCFVELSPHDQIRTNKHASGAETEAQRLATGSPPLPAGASAAGKDAVPESKIALAQMQIRIPAERRYALDDIRLLRMHVAVCASPGCARPATDAYTCGMCRSYRWCPAHQMLYRQHMCARACHPLNFQTLRERLAQVRTAKHENLVMYPVVQGWFKALADNLEETDPAKCASGQLWQQFRVHLSESATQQVHAAPDRMHEDDSSTRVDTRAELVSLLMHIAIKVAPQLRAMETASLARVHKKLRQTAPACVQDAAVESDAAATGDAELSCPLEEFLQRHCDFLTDVVYANSHLPTDCTTRAIYRAKQSTLQRWRIHRESAHEYNIKELLDDSR
jgi:hypothetical protein